VHDSAVGDRDASGALISLLGSLDDPDRRQEVAAAVARELGGRDLLLFARDPELDVLLPAPGLRQVLRNASEWREFLERCRDRPCRGTLTLPDGEVAEVSGCALADGTAAILVLPSRDGAGSEPLLPLLPLLGALFRLERKVAAEVVNARSAAEAVARSRQLAETLQQMRARLEDALVEADQARQAARERAEEAERAREEADAANRAKSDFLASMSHELRTPINAVIGYAQLLNLGITGPITEKQKEQLDRIRTSSDHLLTLVNDVLDLAKVEAGQMSVEHERHGIVEVVAEANDLMEVQAVERNITLTIRCDRPGATYVGDRDRVRQILVNLLSNAVKFTDAGGSVSVHCSLVEEPEDAARLSGGGPWVRVQVEDTGIGISEEDLRQVFQPFVQAESGPTRKRGGTGLGLTISRQLARLMGGDLTVRSREGEGSCFTLWLPAGAAVAGEPDPTIRVGAAGDMGARPEGLMHAGAALQTEAATIIREFARNLRADPDLSGFPEIDEGDILEHAPVLVAGLASLMIKLGRSGGEPSGLWSGNEVQRLVAEEHGANRARHGWAVDSLHREFAILRKEIERAIRGAFVSSTQDADGVIDVVDRLLAEAEDASLIGFRSVDMAAGRT
jgi:signal transduction histidine kinase